MTQKSTDHSFFEAKPEIAHFHHAFATFWYNEVKVHPIKGHEGPEGK
jgi:hypothetical protein